MLKIKDDVDLKELEKFGYMKWNKEKGNVAYFRLVPEIRMIIQVLRNKEIDFILSLGNPLKEEDIKLETFIDDLIQAGLVEKV